MNQSIKETIFLILGCLSKQVHVHFFKIKSIWIALINNII